MSKTIKCVYPMHVCGIFSSFWSDQLDTAVRSLGPHLWDKCLLDIITRYSQQSISSNLQACEKVRWNNIFLQKNNCFNTLTSLAPSPPVANYTASNLYYQEQFKGKKWYLHGFLFQGNTDILHCSLCLHMVLCISFHPVNQNRHNTKVKRYQLEYLKQHNQLWLADSLGAAKAKTRSRIYSWNLFNICLEVAMSGRPVLGDQHQEI